MAKKAKPKVTEFSREQLEELVERTKSQLTAEDHALLEHPRKSLG